MTIRYCCTILSMLLICCVALLIMQSQHKSTISSLQNDNEELRKQLREKFAFVQTEEERRAKVAANLKQIALACHTYDGRGIKKLTDPVSRMVFGSANETDWAIEGLKW